MAKLLVAAALVLALLGCAASPPLNDYQKQLRRDRLMAPPEPPLYSPFR